MVSGRTFTIAIFMTALGLMIPVVNSVSPFGVQPAAISNPAASAKYWAGQAGVSVGSAGQVTGNATLPSAGPSISTTMIFGDFWAALVFIADVVVAVGLPSYYVMGWLGGPNSFVAIGVAAVFQAVVWASYALDYFYIMSNRVLHQQ
jgi:hypothetical protein